MFGLSGSPCNLYIQNYINLMGNCVHYMHGFFGFVENQKSVDTLNEQNCKNPTGNCVYQMYGFFGFAKKLNIQNCVN